MKFGLVSLEYTKRRILIYEAKGYRTPKITKLSEREGIVASRRSVSVFLSRVQETGSINRCPGSGRPTKQTEFKELIEAAMRTYDETTSKELREQLASAGHSVRLTTTLRCRRGLDWTVRGSAYCQMIRKRNKAKRLGWARKHLHEETRFLDVIFTNETSIQSQTRLVYNHKRDFYAITNETTMESFRHFW